MSMISKLNKEVLDELNQIMQEMLDMGSRNVRLIKRLQRDYAEGLRGKQREYAMEWIERQ